MIRTKHALLAVVSVFMFWALAMLASKCNTEMDRQQREDEAAFVAHRNANPDAIACRQRGGIPVWGNGWNAGTGTVVDCRPLPAPSWGDK